MRSYDNWKTSPPEPAPCHRCSDEGWIDCPWCDGDGSVLDEDGNPAPCDDCGGNKEVRCAECY